MSLRSEWNDFKAGMKALALLPWVVIRDLGKMIWGAVHRRSYQDRRKDMLDTTFARPLASAREKAGEAKKSPYKAEVSISASIAQDIESRHVRSTTMKLVRPPEPIIDPIADYRYRIGERIRAKFPDARLGTTLAGYTAECVRDTRVCDICGRVGVNLLAFSADFSKPGQPFQLMQKHMCKDFEACDFRAKDNEAHEEVS